MTKQEIYVEFSRPALNFPKYCAYDWRCCVGHTITLASTAEEAICKAALLALINAAQGSML